MRGGFLEAQLLRPLAELGGGVLCGQAVLGERDTQAGLFDVFIERVRLANGSQVEGIKPHQGDEFEGQKRSGAEEGGKVETRMAAQTATTFLALFFVVVVGEAGDVRRVMLPVGRRNGRGLGGFFGFRMETGGDGHGVMLS